MSQTEPMDHTARIDGYTRRRRRMTARQARQYNHKLNRLYGPAEGEKPRRADARAAMLERRRG